MRIGMVVPGFSADERDWCIPALRHLVARLATTEDLRVLALRYPCPPARYSLFGAEVTALGGAGQGWRSAGVWGRALATLAAEHRRRPFDVLHAFWANETGAVAAVAGRLLGIPSVVSLAGGELVALRDIGYGGQLARAERMKVRLALGLAGAVAAGSRYLLALAAPWLGSRRRDRVRWAPLGVEVATFRPAAPGAEGPLPRLLHVASLVPVKDQATLLRSAAHLRDRGAAFLLEIVGAGPLEPDLRSLAGQLGLGESVRFRGELSHDRLPALYRGSAVFLLSSRHEAQGMAALEAAACGVPIVGTRVGIVPELAPEAALAVPVGDPAALAESLALLLDDPARRLAMGAAARARVEAEFSLERSVERFLALYSALL